LTTTLLTITAFVAGVWMLKGAWSLGIYELVVSLALATLAVGILSDPVDLVAGDDGYIVKSAQVGLQLSDGIVNGPGPPGRPPPCTPGAPCPVSADASDGDSTTFATENEVLEEQTQNLVDVFIRMPQQAVNFGEIIDGTGCESEYDDWMEAEIVAEPDRWARVAFAECNPDASAVAENPDMGLVITSATITPGAIIILLFAALIAGVVLWCAVWVLFQSVKAIIALVVALLPGNSRNTFWSTIAEVLVWLGLLIFSLVFLAVYLVVVADVMQAQQDMGTIAMFLIVDIILLLGLIAFWRARGAMARVAERLTKTMGMRPGSKPTTMVAVLKQPPPDLMGNTVMSSTGATKSGYTKIRNKLRRKPSAPMSTSSHRAASASASRTDGGRGMAPTGTRRSEQSGSNPVRDPVSPKSPETPKTRTPAKKADGKRSARKAQANGTKDAANTSSTEHTPADQEKSSSRRARTSTKAPKTTSARKPAGRPSASTKQPETSAPVDADRVDAYRTARRTSLRRRLHRAGAPVKRR
jgi:hypothetical protein